MLRLELPLGQAGQRLGVGHPAVSVEHGLARLAQDLGHHRRQLDVRPLQHLLQPIDLPRSLPHQRRPLPRQLAQLPLLPVRDEAPAEQAVPQQVGDPLAVLDVGLAARDRLDVPGVGQQQLEAALQQVVVGSKRGAVRILTVRPFPRSALRTGREPFRFIRLSPCPCQSATLQPAAPWSPTATGSLSLGSGSE